MVLRINEIKNYVLPVRACITAKQLEVISRLKKKKRGYFERCLTFENEERVNEYFRLGTQGGTQDSWPFNMASLLCYYALTAIMSEPLASVKSLLPF